MFVVIATIIQVCLLSLIFYVVSQKIYSFNIKKRLLVMEGLEKKSKISQNIDILLARSGIKNKVSFINVRTVLYISFALFLLGVILFRKLGIACMFYAAILVFMPYSGLMFLASINSRKIKESYLSFLTTFTGFYSVEGNIITALKSTSSYISDPLKSILRRNIFIYEKTQMSVDDCMKNISQEANNREFAKFINFARMNVKYGGNFTKALAKLREQAEMLFSLETIKAANASVGSMVILAMIVINLVLMANISSDPATAETIRNTITGQVIAISNAAAIMFGLYMIRNISLST